MKPRIVCFLLVVCAVFAALISYNLVLTHVMGTSGQTWFDAGCSAEAGATFNCKEVLQSPYSSFPTKSPDEPPGKWHVPVAFLGLLYYTSLAVWFVGIGVPSRQRAWLHAIVSIVVAAGLLGSVYYMWVMASKIDAWCPWCLATHALNLLIATGVVLLWPVVLRRPWTISDEEQIERDRGPRKTSASGRAAESTRPSPLAPHPLPLVPGPAGRVIVITILALVAVNFAYVNMLGLKTWRRMAEVNKSQFDTCLTQVNSIRNDPVLLATHWERTAEQPVPVRPDDPVRHYKSGETAQPPLDVIVFSDFECPSCEKFARFFEAQVMPMFGGHIQVTFKHYPIDKSCNPKAGATLHPHACEAAKMAEAARALGGSAAFWKAHDFLFNHRDKLARGQVSPARFASEVGLDPQAVRQGMGSKEIADRILADAELATRLGLTGTPGIFVQNRVVGQLAKDRPGFWDTLADMYWNGVGVPRPESTRPAARAKPAQNP